VSSPDTKVKNWLDVDGEWFELTPRKWAHSPFGNLIAQFESGGDYNICNETLGGLSVVRDLKLTELTIKQVQEKQTARDIFATGRYQIIPKTLNSAINALKLDTSLKYDEVLQDKIFDEYLIDIKRPPIINYLEGDGTVSGAMYAAAKEWASIGVEKGKKISSGTANGGESYYAGDGLNKAHITPGQIKQALIKSKNNE